MTYAICRLTANNCKPLIDDATRGSVNFGSEQIAELAGAQTVEIINRLDHTDIVVSGTVISRTDGSVVARPHFLAWIPRTALIKRLPFEVKPINPETKLVINVAAMPLSSLQYGKVAPASWANYNPVISNGVPGTIDARNLTISNPIVYQMSVPANAAKFAYGFDVVLAEHRMYPVSITATVADGTEVHTQIINPDNPHRRVSLFLPTNEMVVLLRISMFQLS